MDTDANPDGPEILLGQRAWVRRVARALVDEATASDLEQEAWLRTVGRPAPRAPRAWLGTVLRRLAANLRRGERRRARRERTIARPVDRVADPADVVARAETAERVARAAMDLQEPYRTAVLMRYFEECSPPEIARRLGVPVETVRTRLRRALGRLRARLDATGGGKGAWLSAALPLAVSPTGTTPVAAAGIGGLLVGTKLKLAIGTLVLLLLGLVIGFGVPWPSRDGDGPPREARADRDADGTEGRARPIARPGVGLADPTGVEGGPATGDSRREPSGESGAPSGIGRAADDGAAAGDLEGPSAVAGRVVDESTGRGIAGVRVSLEGRRGGPAAETDADGSFRLGPAPAGALVLATRAPGTPWLPARLTGVRAGASGVVLRVRRGLVVEGRVVDDAGGPVATEIRLAASPSGVRLDSSRTVRGKTRPDGSFVLGPLEPGAYDLEAMAWPPVGTTLLPGTLEGVAAGSREVVFRLRRGASFRGRVVDEDGRPVASGKVTVLATSPGGAQESWQSPVLEDGTFASFTLDPDRVYDLEVHCPGGRSAILRGVRPDGDPLRIVLVRPSGTIRGAVVDETGRPMGAGVRVSARARDLPEGEPGGQGHAVTDETGTFIIEGLGDHSFRLGLMDGGVLPSFVPGEFRAGSEPIRLVARRGLVVSGRVLDSERHPVESGRVLIEGATYRNSSLIGRDGRFRLNGLPSGRVTLRMRLGARTVLLGSFDLPAEDLELVLPPE